jgi:hypothetical protein
MRGLIDRKGEQFAYLQGSMLYTLDGEQTGRLEGEFVLDMAGNKIWRIVGDAVYSLDGMESVGYFGSEKQE